MVVCYWQDRALDERRERFLKRRTPLWDWLTIWKIPNARIVASFPGGLRPGLSAEISDSSIASESR